MEESNNHFEFGNSDSMSSDVLAKTFVKLLAIPSVSKGHFTETNEIISVYSEWSSDDVTSKGTTAFAKVHTLIKSNEIPKLVHETSPLPFNAKLKCFSKGQSQRGLLAVVSKKEEGEILQIFANDKLEKSFDLKELDLHKNIYASPFWGCTMAWSPDGNKLMYLAEKKTVKVRPFFTTHGIETIQEPKLIFKSNGNEVPNFKGNRLSEQGEEFAFKQSWGEQLEDCFQSVIVVLDITTEQFKVLDLPDNIFPCDLQWDGISAIVGTGYTDFSWRLGLIYCSNRDSRIFQVNHNGENFRYLSEAGRAAFCPRVRPDQGSFIIWQERKVGGPHDNSREIVGCKLTEGVKKYIIYAAGNASEIPVFANFPQCCWTLDGTKFFTITQNEISYVLLTFTMSEDSVLLKPEVTENVKGILSVGKNYALISRSSSRAESQSVHLLDINDRHRSWVVSVGQCPVSVAVKCLKIEGFSPASFYYGPSDQFKLKSVPLVVIPHGGPHSVLTDEFSPETALFLESGYGVLFINYIGSIGGSSDPEELCGKIGSADLEHCQRITKQLLDTNPTINPEKVAIFGGSHGGFLGAHLTSSFPDFYKAAVLRNPVTDLTSIISTSDITDWAIVEAGISHETNNYLPFVRNVADAEKLVQWSPIRHVDKVKAATLLLLGSEDLRVPMSQGLGYYRALKHCNKETEVRLYNDCHSLAKKVPCRFDVMIQTMLWFKKYLKYP